MLSPDTVHALQGVLALRHWLQEHLPHTAALPSSLGGDLFLELAEGLAQGRDVDLDLLAREMAYPREAIATALDLMQRQGLLNCSATGRVETTAAFAALLDDYQQQLQSHFIPRQALRSTQLQLEVADATQAAAVQALYDRCFDLGWLYLHRYGSTCFMLARVVQALLARQGHVARVQVGHVEVRRDNKVYYLGRLRDPAPGRIEAHAWCVVDDQVVVDFALGNVRRYYRSNFPWAVAVDGAQPGAEQATLCLPEGDRLRWMAGGPAATADAVAEELRNCELVLPRLLAEHDQRFGPA